MAEKTKIEWAHHTFNPWIGCTKVGPGCDHCYAEADFDKRKHVVQWGAGNPRKRTAPSTWAQPLRWNREAERRGVRYRVFCASLADVFDNEVPAEWRRDLFDLIAVTPHLDWLLVTKRIGNVQRMVEAATLVSALPNNVWLGITVVNQAEADRDIPKLLDTPAAVRFLSMEPLLGPVDLFDISPNRGDSPEDHFSALYDPDDDQADTLHYVNWIIVGGESGRGARPMHPQWVRSIRDQCAAAGVPFLFKQHGEWLATDFCDGDMASLPAKRTVYVCPNGDFHSGKHGVDFFGGDQETARVGKKAAGRLLDGQEHNGFPGAPQ